MVAVRARVGEDVHAAVAHLYRQGVGVGVRGDAEESMRAAVASAPDLGCLPAGRAQQRQASVGEAPGPLRRAARDLPRRGWPALR